ncbi:hypothetical protein [Deinococcus rufus]|uniref:Uncharacterized protein n=1 Tax=Deinococcus rufus TaxID=2136097 RepID=A0ABV7ZB68_9DEIO
MAYNRNRRGPDPAGAFLVLEGVVAVIGFECTLVLPPTTVWPGHLALPDDLVADLGLGDTLLSAGARTTPWTPSPRDIEVATALVTAQLLRVGPLEQRLARLAALCDVHAQGTETSAHLLGTTRESLSKFLNQRRHAAD